MSTFVYPESATLNIPEQILSAEQVNQWRDHGFVLINNIIEPNVLQTAIKDASLILKDFYRDNFGGLQFPTTSDAINQIAINTRLLNAVQQLLNTSNIKLLQADMWKKTGIKLKKYTKYQNYDQRMHMDYPNHTLVHPPLWNEPTAVEIIIYFSHCEDTGGSTAVVPKENDNDPAYQWPYIMMPGVGKMDWVNDRKLAEEYIAENDKKMFKFRQALYKREKYVYFTPGTILFYRHDLWHRGVPIKYGKTRWVQNLTFGIRDSNCYEQWHGSITHAMYHVKDDYSRIVEKLIAKITPFQRSVLGFPKPGDPYWNEYTLEAVRKRYESFGLDIEPYKQAMTTSDNRIFSKL